MSNIKIKTVQQLVELIESLDPKTLQTNCLVSMLNPQVTNLITLHFRKLLRSATHAPSELLIIKSIGSVFGLCSPNLFENSLIPTKTNVLVFLKAI